MDTEFTANIELFLHYVTGGLRFLGLLIFGLMSAWLTMQTFTKAAKAWQVQAVAVIGFLYLAGVMINSPHSAAASAFAFGAGAGLFIWGFSKEKIKSDSAK
jgi:hypothetical protein